MIEVKREVRELAVVVAGLEEEVESAVRRHGELRTKHRHLRGGARLRPHRDARRRDRDRHGRQGSAAVSRASSTEGRRRGEEIERELGQVEASLSTIGDEEQLGQKEIEAARVAKAEAEQELSAQSEVLEQRRQASDAQSTRVTEVRVLAAQARERAEGDRGAMERLNRSMEELDQRSSRMADDLADAARQQGHLVAQVVLCREQLHASVRDAMDAHEALAEVRAYFDRPARPSPARKSRSRSSATRSSRASDQVSGLTLRERELAMELDHLLDTIAERHRVDLRKVLTDFHVAGDPRRLHPPAHRRAHPAHRAHGRDQPHGDRGVRGEVASATSTSPSSAPTSRTRFASSIAPSGR